MEPIVISFELSNTTLYAIIAITLLLAIVISAKSFFKKSYTNQLKLLRKDIGELNFIRDDVEEFKNIKDTIALLKEECDNVFFKFKNLLKSYNTILNNGEELYNNCEKLYDEHQSLLSKNKELLEIYKYLNLKNYELYNLNKETSEKIDKLVIDALLTYEEKQTLDKENTDLLHKLFARENYIFPQVDETSKKSSRANDVTTSLDSCQLSMEQNDPEQAGDSVDSLFGPKDQSNEGKIKLYRILKSTTIKEIPTLDQDFFFQDWTSVEESLMQARADLLSIREKTTEAIVLYKEAQQYLDKIRETIALKHKRVERFGRLEPYKKESEIENEVAKIKKELSELIDRNTNHFDLKLTELIDSGLWKEAISQTSIEIKKLKAVQEKNLGRFDDIADGEELIERIIKSE